jgi:hypothetical protein
VKGGRIKRKVKKEWKTEAGDNRRQRRDTINVAHVTFEGFAAVTMKNVVFWDIKPSSYFTGDTLRLRYRVQPVNAM